MMIGYFPAPYPDELLYSLFARFAERMQYPSSAAVVRDLFGNRHASAVVTLPNKLSVFADNLPPGYPLTADDFIDRHTMLPFYMPFYSLDRINRARESMKSGGRNVVQLHLGAQWVFLSKSRLLFCPVCVQSDRQRFGEAYWHRVHQAPRVEVCPVHWVWLQQSDARARYLMSRRAFVTAESVINFAQPHTLDLSNSHHQVVLDIARTVAWLLAQNGDVEGDLRPFRDRYLALCIKVSRAVLQERYSSVYDGLYQIPRVKRGGMSSRVDWEDYDSRTAEEVRESALRLENAPGRPKRITKYAIAKDIGWLAIGRVLDKLPQTAEALADVVETWEEFAVRRVWWVAGLYRQEGIYPTRSQLVRRASVYRKPIADCLQVVEAVDTALEALKACLRP